jgi:protein gp37
MATEFQMSQIEWTDLTWNPWVGCTEVPKRAFLRPADRLAASAVPYVAKAQATASDDDYVLSLMRGDRDTYEKAQRPNKLVSEADKERWETEARWHALLGEFREFGEFGE